MKLYINLIIFLLIASCATKKDVLILNDLNNLGEKNFNYVDYKIKVNDILKIDISSPNIVNQFEFNSNPNINTSLTLMQVNGFLVNNSGYITLPRLGSIKIIGYTIFEAQDYLYKLLLEGEFLKNHVVEIRIVNYHVTVLGEVNSPGTFNYIENNMNILKAIGLANDLTIMAKRNDIKLIREISSKKHIEKIDLTNSDFIDNEFYQIQSGDIIIVNPNKTRVKNAGVIGNSGTLISLLSFLLTSLIVINN